GPVIIRPAQFHEIGFGRRRSDVFIDPRIQAIDQSVEYATEIKTLKDQIGSRYLARIEVTDATDLVHPVLYSQPLLTQKTGVLTFVLQVVLGFSRVEHVRDVDLLRKPLALLVRREQHVLIVDHELRQPEPATGIVQQETIENRFAV